MLLLTDLLNAKAFDLEQPRFRGMPNHPNNLPPFYYALHRRHEASSLEQRTAAAGLVTTNEHAGTHIDALCHQAEGMVLHGGVLADADVQTPSGFTHEGAETIEPVIRRGVLLDVPSHLGVDKLEREMCVTARELQAVTELQNTTVGSGDVVLVRTGYGALWGDPAEYGHAAGVSSGGSAWLADEGVYAVGADNAAWDVPGVVDDELAVELPGHLLLIARAGIYILEHLYLEELAAAKVYEFAFVCLPLKIVGATGSPARPVALVAGT